MWLENVDATSWSSSSSLSSLKVCKYRLCDIREDVDWANVADKCVVSSNKKSECDALLFKFSIKTEEIFLELEKEKTQ